MAWHILKKDLRLLWAFALAVAASECGAAAIRLWNDRYSGPSQLVTVADLLSVASFLGMIFLIISAMHQDAVPGVRQDWLIRPIRRRDLILAKLLFLLLAVQAPALLIDVGAGLAHGFAFAAALQAAAARNVAILCYFTLPAAALGAATRTVTETFVLTLICFIGYLAVFLVGIVLLLGIKTSVGGTGVSWIVTATWYALAIVGAPVVIALQYARRTTALARGLLAAGGAVVLLAAFVPWRLAFALQEQLAPEPLAARDIALAFDRQAGPFSMPPGAAMPGVDAVTPHAGTGEPTARIAEPGADAAAPLARGAAPRGTTVYLPLRISGIPASADVLMDRAEIRMSDADGRPLYAGRTNLSVDGFGSIEDARFEVRQKPAERGALERRTAENAAARIYERVFLPAAVLARLGSRPVDLHIDYSLTLFRPGAIYTLPAVGGRLMLGGLGSCTSSIDGEGDDVRIRCVSTSKAPPCFTAFLEYARTGLRNPAVHHCVPDYTPASVNGNFWPDALERSAGELPFFDRSGLTHYPVDGAKLADSQVVVETYVPRDHFTRHLDIRGIRLADFTAMAADSHARP